MSETIEPLPYAYDALEPFIDEETMKLHHDKHHQAYFDKFRAAIEKYPELKNKKSEELLSDLDSVPEEIRTAVKNNGGGYVNHSFFWPLLKKDVEPQGEVLKAIEEKWGSFEEFKKEFSNAAATQFGSGWAWLVVDSGTLEIVSTSNQDTPLSEGKVPLLTIDVWEHAYYITYRNKRPEYIEKFFKVINWHTVNEHYLDAKSGGE